MTPDELERVLQLAFEQCEQASAALTSQQQQILRQVLHAGCSASPNPLSELTPPERQTLLQFIRSQGEHQQRWKMTLLNDWLHGRDSGNVQFIRDRYGLQWLEQVQPTHLAAYLDADDNSELQLQVGDRIEVSNGLWEWVQDNEPGSLEWFPCVIVSVQSASEQREGLNRHASCVVRFTSGAEYEIQGVYEWNRAHWRWPTPSSETPR